MKIGDVSRPRRFANPARLRWYALHRSIRFASRMMKAEQTTASSDIQTLQAQPQIAKCQNNLDEKMNMEFCLFCDCCCEETPLSSPL
jgi:hypothetical protein